MHRAMYNNLLKNCCLTGELSLWLLWFGFIFLSGQFHDWIHFHIQTKINDYFDFLLRWNYAVILNNFLD